MLLASSFLEAGLILGCFGSAGGFFKSACTSSALLWGAGRLGCTMYKYVSMTPQPLLWDWICWLLRIERLEIESGHSPLLVSCKVRCHSTSRVCIFDWHCHPYLYQRYHDLRQQALSQNPTVTGITGYHDRLILQFARLIVWLDRNRQFYGFCFCKQVMLALTCSWCILLDRYILFLGGFPNKKLSVTLQCGLTSGVLATALVGSHLFPKECESFWRICPRPGFAWLCQRQTLLQGDCWALLCLVIGFAKLSFLLIFRQCRL